MPSLPRWRASDLRQWPQQRDRDAEACPCRAHPGPGWESVHAPLSAPAFECLATLVDTSAAEEPTLTEWHPAGTSYWSPSAPIAVDWFPCNRCTVWRCTRCGRGFLQYTEFGGYYVDHRLRPLDPALVV